ncbi:MAG: L-lactate permease [Anaerolineae bacterium]|jgi:lactate permease|nr:L-lactate permease [Anaerolineae bacterium]
MPILLAFFPILLILILMVGFRWGAVRAGAVGYMAALIIAIAFFGANLQVLAYAHLKALILSFDVLFIIWAAYILYRVSDEAGAIATIGQALRQLTSDKGMQAILIGWVFASFLQGTGGFGVPVAITAPLLVGLGFSPLAAVVIPTIGHGWAVTFGSLGSSFNALISSTGLDAAYLAPTSALFLGLSAIPTGLMIIHIANRETRKVSKNHANFLDDGDKRDGFMTDAKMKPFGSVLDMKALHTFPKLGWQAIIIGVVMGGVQYLVAVNLGMWNIASFAGGLAGLLIGVPLAYWGQASSKRACSALTLSPLPEGEGTILSPQGKVSGRQLLIALSAYLILIVITASILLLPSVNPLKDALGQLAIEVHFPETITNSGYITPAGSNKPIYIFKHAGAILLYSAAAAFVVYKRAGLYGEGVGKKILSQTAKKMKFSTISIFLMVSMAMIMQQAGMTETLAQGLAESVGRAYPFAASWIGALGAFMTGSNTNSNLLFAGLQMRTAGLLDYSVPIILAAQTASASVASVIAPAKLIVGASTAGMEGKEGEVLRTVIGYAGILVLFISLFTVLGVILP